MFPREDKKRKGPFGLLEEISKSTIFWSYECNRTEGVKEGKKKVDKNITYESKELFTMLNLSMFLSAKIV